MSEKTNGSAEAAEAESLDEAEAEAEAEVEAEPEADEPDANAPAQVGFNLLQFPQRDLEVQNTSSKRLRTVVKSVFEENEGKAEIVVNERLSTCSIHCVCFTEDNCSI